MNPLIVNGHFPFIPVNADMMKSRRGRDGQVCKNKLVVFFLFSGNHPFRVHPSRFLMETSTPVFLGISKLMWFKGGEGGPYITTLPVA